MKFSIDSTTKFYESIFNEANEKDKLDSWKSNIKSLKVSLLGKVIKPENVADVENIEFSEENYQSLLGSGVKTPIEFVRMGWQW